MYEKNGADASGDPSTTTPTVTGSSTALPNGVLASLMYTDECGTCVTCEVLGVFGPPPLASRKEGRLSVHVTAPLLRRHGGESAVGGGVELLRRNVDVLSSGQEDLPLRQLEGFVSSVLHKCIDLRQLCVLEGEACWVLTVSLTLLNADGGLYGSTLAAAVAALQNLQLPRSLLPNGDVVEPRILRLSSVPLACTYGIFMHPIAGPTWLADICAGEELVVDSQVTITLSEQGGLVDLRQWGPTMGLTEKIMNHWAKEHLNIRKIIGW